MRNLKRFVALLAALALLCVVTLVGSWTLLCGVSMLALAVAVVPSGTMRAERHRTTSGSRRDSPPANGGECRAMSNPWRHSAQRSYEHPAYRARDQDGLVTVIDSTTALKNPRSMGYLSVSTALTDPSRAQNSADAPFGLFAYFARDQDGRACTSLAT